MSEREFHRHMEAFERQQARKGFSETKGYAERFHEHANSAGGMKVKGAYAFEKTIAAAIALVLIFAAMMTGRWVLMFWIGVALVIARFAYHMIGKARAIHGQDEREQDHLDRKAGRDKRFGRYGAERRKR